MWLLLSLSLVQVNIRRRLILFVLTDFVVYLSFVLLTGSFFGAGLVLRLPSNPLVSHQPAVVDWCVVLLKAGHVVVVNQPFIQEKNNKRSNY